MKKYKKTGKCAACGGACHVRAKLCSKCYKKKTGRDLSKAGFKKGNTLGHKFEENEGHWHWNGGVRQAFSSNGAVEYRKVKTGKAKYIFQHRLIMEKQLGRKLKSNEVVHHLNGDGLDNRICNLQVMDRGEHTTLHKTETVSSRGGGF